MKYSGIFLFFLASSLFAESPFERELSQLGQQREHEVSAAMDPINRRYKDALESLLRRATQANDLDGALKIREVLKQVSPTGVPAAAAAVNPTPVAAAGAGAKVTLTKKGLEKQLEKTAWETPTNNWLHRFVIEDGKVIHNPNDKGQGRSAQFHAMDGATIVYEWDGKPCTITFSADLSQCMRGTIPYRKKKE